MADPEQKRKIIGREFIRAFEQAAREIAGESDAATFLVQGTLYPDVVESGGGTGTANIKSHHNVGGLPDDLKFELVEPLRDLFKDEVRQVGTELGLPEAMVWRQPFPGPGLAIRIVGEVTAERLRIVSAADAIARAELSAAGLDRQIWQCPVVLLADVRSVGVQGDGRSYGYPDRAAAGEQRGRDDGRLVPAARRGARPDLDPDHQRGAGDQPGRARHHQQAASHHRVGVAPSAAAAGARPGAARWQRTLPGELAGRRERVLAGGVIVAIAVAMGRCRPAAAAGKAPPQPQPARRGQQAGQPAHGQAGARVAGRDDPADQRAADRRGALECDLPQRDRAAAHVRVGGELDGRIADRDERDAGPADEQQRGVGQRRAPASTRRPGWPAPKPVEAMIIGRSPVRPRAAVNRPPITAPIPIAAVMKPKTTELPWKVCLASTGSDTWNS